MIKKIITTDKTESFLNEIIGESYHPQTGVVEEVLNKYIIPTKIAEKSRSGELKILDFCFGLGYNSAMAVDAALKENPACKIVVIGLEKDMEIIKRIQEVNPPIKSYAAYKKINLFNLVVLDNNLKIKVILGDGREKLKDLKTSSFDAVFFDPFSPINFPDMWDAKVFKEVCRVMKNDAILATYTSSGIARINMSAAGLFWSESPGIGRRGPGTFAKKWV